MIPHLARLLKAKTKSGLLSLAGIVAFAGFAEGSVVKPGGLRRQMTELSALTLQRS